MPPERAFPSAASPALPVSVDEIPLTLFCVVYCPSLSASPAAPAAESAKRVGRYVDALDLRVPLIHGIPSLSEIQPMPPSVPVLFCVLPLPVFFPLASGWGTVRTVPSAKTKVILFTCPRTQESVQSPLALPETIAPSTSGSSIPLAVRLSLPISTLKGYGSVTVPLTGMRPNNAVIARLPTRVEFSGRV